MSKPPVRGNTPTLPEVPTSPGTFLNGLRLTTPSGVAMLPPRPVSQLAVRMRGVCPGSVEDNARIMSPDVVSCGSVQLCRSRTTSRGSWVISPPCEGTRPIAIRVRSVVHVPQLSAIPSYVASVKHLLNFKGRTNSAALRIAPDADKSVKRIFSDGDGSPLHHNYCHSILHNRDSLLFEPSIHVGIENMTEQTQIARCATLLHALLQFKGKVERHDFVPVVRNKELVNLVPLERLFGHTREIAMNDEGGLDDRLHYYESMRHVIVGFRGMFFEMEVIEPAGRVLESSELYKRLQSITAGGMSPVCTLPFGVLSMLPREDFYNVTEEIAEHCLSNRACIERLNSALFFVSISELGCEVGEAPTVGPPDPAQWLQSTLRLTVLPNGNSILRSSVLTCDVAILASAARWIATAANCDPMLEYRPKAPRKMEVKRTIRTPTPSAQPGKRGAKGASPAKGGEEEISTVTETITLPGPEPAAEPRLLPLWMPAEFCESFVVPRNFQPYCVKNFELSLHEEYTLHLACLLALHHIKPDRVPIVHAASYSAVRDPAIHLCASNEIDSALRHTAQFTKLSGPLPTEVIKACRRAIDSLRRIVTRDPPHISDLRVCVENGIVEPTGEGGNQQLLDLCDLMLSNQQDVTPPNAIGHRGSSGIMWVLQTSLRVGHSAPFLSYFVEPAYRSSLRGTLGDLFTCSLVYRPQGDAHEAKMVQLMELISVFARYWDERLWKVHCNEPSMWLARARLPR